jgi:flavin reductase (DIM6/NTAB) family NADH-FMN oxidoreductase RutF
VLPRPIAWVVTEDAAGRRNAAPYSFFNAMGDAPPVIALGLTAGRSGLKDTATNILATGEFVVNLVPESLAPAMNLTAIDAPRGVDELDLAGLTTLPSVHIRPPRIAGSPVAFECRLFQAIETGPAQLTVIGRVLAVHVDDAVLRNPERGHVDRQAMGLIARAEGNSYLRSQDGFALDRPRWTDRQTD